MLRSLIWISALFLLFDLALAYHRVDLCENHTGKTCMDFCRMGFDRMRNPANKDDMYLLNKLYGRDKINFKYNETTGLLSWATKGNLTGRRSQITVTAFHVQYLNLTGEKSLRTPAEHGTPIRTCCGVSITAGNCSVYFEDVGQLYVGLTLNATRLSLDTKYHDLVERPYQTCWWQNKSILLCLFVTKRTGLMWVNSMIDNLGNTNGYDYAEDSLKRQMGDFCVYQLPKDDVEKHGTEVREKLLDTFFQRRVWDVTKHWYKRVKRNCTKKELVLDHLLDYPTKHGHLVCFRMEMRRTNTQMEHYCMPGKKNVTVIERNEQTESQFSVAIILLCIFAGIVIILLVVFAAFTATGKTRKFMKNVKSLPPGLMDIEKKLGDKRGDDELVSTDESKEEVEPLTLGTVEHLASDEKQQQHNDNRFEHGIAVSIGDNAGCPQQGPVGFVSSGAEGNYLAKPESSSTGFTDGSSGLTESMCSSSGVSSGQTSDGNDQDIDPPICFKSSNRLSETSNDTGRGSSGCGSDNETDMQGLGKKPLLAAGMAPSDPRKPDARLLFRDDVFVDELKIDHTVGPPPGSEKIVFDTFFAKTKHISTDSAVGRLSQDEALPDYSVLAD